MNPKFKEHLIELGVYEEFMYELRANHPLTIQRFFKCNQYSWMRFIMTAFSWANARDQTIDWGSISADNINPNINNYEKSKS